MSVLAGCGVEYAHHYAPLHYLPFIARSGVLLGKPSLAQAGFPPSHLRSKSSNQDKARGFGAYAFLTLDGEARILNAKLEAGFPHIDIRVPAAAFGNVQYALCRYNVAMTRYLRRNGVGGFPESATNGRYYNSHQIPIARTQADKRAMLNYHLPRSTMIEVLVAGDLPLPPETQIACFDPADAELARDTLTATQRPWTVVLTHPPGPYNRKENYVQAVEGFIAEAIANPAWRGNGLEFDRV